MMEEKELIAFLKERGVEIEGSGIYSTYKDTPEEILIGYDGPITIKLGSVQSGGKK